MEAGIIGIALAGGWFVAGSIWLVLAAVGICVLGPLYVMSRWTDDDVIERSGFRFVGAIAMSTLMCWLLAYGGVPVHEYLFGHWWSALVCVAYLTVGAFWMRYRLNPFLGRLIKGRDELLVQFCASIKETKQLFDEMERLTNEKNKKNAGRLTGSDQTPYVPEKIEDHQRYCAALCTGHDHMMRNDFMPLAQAMEPYLSGKNGLPEVMLPHWEAYYERAGKHLLSGGLTATASNADKTQNIERIGLWLFFWPSSMLRNVFTLLGDIIKMVVENLGFMYKDLFAKHTKEFKVVSATPPNAPNTTDGGEEKKVLTIPVLVRRGGNEG